MLSYRAKPWATALSFDPERVLSFQNEMVGDVRVAAMTVDGTTPKLLRTYYRSFVIARKDGVFHKELSCSISPNASTKLLNDVTKFLDSLSFEASTAP